MSGKFLSFSQAIGGNLRPRIEGSSILHDIFWTSSSPLRHLRHFVWPRHCVLVIASITRLACFFYIVHLLAQLLSSSKKTASSCPGNFGASISIWTLDAHSPFWFLTVGRLLGFSLKSHVTMPLPPFLNLWLGKLIRIYPGTSGYSWVTGSPNLVHLTQDTDLARLYSRTEAYFTRREGNLPASRISQLSSEF